MQNVIREAYRVLKPGGRFLCMEFSQIENSNDGSDGSINNNPTKNLLSSAYDLYSFKLIPWMGELIANDRESYQYLVER